MSDRTIYVDIDDVLCETAQYCLRIVEREFGKKVEFDKLFVFDLGISCGLSSAERDHLYEVIHHPWEIVEVDPIPNAIQTLHRWQARDYDIALVTGPPAFNNRADPGVDRSAWRSLLFPYVRR
jgi:hypothetical protein